MDTFTLSRGKGTDQGTLGLLTGPGLALFTIELPWRYNQKSISHIPPGSYACKLYYSPSRKQNLYLLADVPSRSGVLIHAGNWAGDIALGFRSNSQGCILLGTARGTADGQLAVLNSAAAMRVFHERTGGEPFTLVITGSKS
jgi:hypothetical protein